MVCLELKPRAAGWQVQTNPLSYDGTIRNWHFRTHLSFFFHLFLASNSVTRLGDLSDFGQVFKAFGNN